jgi:hypothetical protein
VSRFAICINDESNPVSLILGKAYRMLPEVAERALMSAEG